MCLYMCMIFVCISLFLSLSLYIYIYIFIVQWIFGIEGCSIPSQNLLWHGHGYQLTYMYMYIYIYICILQYVCSYCNTLYSS